MTCKRQVSGSNPLTGSTTTAAIMPSLPAVTRLLVGLAVVAIHAVSARLVATANQSLLHVGCTALGALVDLLFGRGCGCRTGNAFPSVTGAHRMMVPMKEYHVTCTGHCATGLTTGSAASLDRGLTSMAGRDS